MDPGRAAGKRRAATEAPGGPPRKKSAGGEIVVYNNRRRTFMYLVPHHDRALADQGVYVYAGQTVQLGTKRAAGHESNAKKQIREKGEATTLMVSYIAWLESEGKRLKLVGCPWFPEGVPEYRADGFECLMIEDFKTNVTPHGKNTSRGNNLGLHLPKFDEYRAELAENGGVYKWSEADLAMADGVPREVIEADGVAAALEKLHGMAENAGVAAPLLKEEASTALVVAEDTRRRCLGPLALAEHFRDKYEAQLPCLIVNSDEFNKDLNALRDKLKDVSWNSEDEDGLCRAAALMTKRPVTASFVSHQFFALANAIAQQEEDQFPNTDEVKLAKDMRKVLFSTGLSALRQHGPDVSREESNLSKRLYDWKCKHKESADGFPNLGHMRFILRFRPEAVRAFDEYVMHDKKGAMRQAAIEINRMLLEGHKHPNEPDFAGSKAFPCGAQGTETNKVYNVMRNIARNILDKNIAPERLALALQGMEEKWPARYAWWIAPTGLPHQIKAAEAAAAASSAAGPSSSSA